MFKKLDDILKRYEFLSAQLSDANVISDMGAFAKISKERADIQETAEKYIEYLACEREMKEAFAGAEEESDPEMRKLFSDEAYVCKERLSGIKEELKILLLPKDKNDERSCILEIRAGAGGEEAALFAAELCRMYQNYCAAHRLRVEAADVNSTELGGVKEAVYNVSGKGAYKLLKYESGVHRVQRVPETETQGRIHTSTATVAVLPEAEDVEVEINDKDIRIDIFHSGGAGGQNVNKVETAVRLRYHGKDADTGEAVEFLIENMETRSQLMNRENAMRILKSKLYQRELDKRMATQQALEASKKKIEWGSQIRSYVFDDRRVKDHRTGVQTSAVEAVMDGGLDEFIKAYLMEYGAEA